MAKYKVLKTCHTHGRYCVEGSIVDIDGEVKNKHLKKVDGGVEVKKVEEPKESFASIAKASIDKIKTGMAAPNKDEEEEKPKDK